jgi:hypothetical protein
MISVGKIEKKSDDRRTHSGGIFAARKKRQVGVIFVEK